MKKILYIVPILFLSCASPFIVNTKNYEEKHENLLTAWKKTSKYHYIVDEYGDYWKSPMEFEKDKGGDCEDFSAYLVYLLGPEASMIGIHTKTSNHMIVLYKGDYIEPQTYKKYYKEENLDIFVIYDYWESMALVTWIGIKAF